MSGVASTLAKKRALAAGFGTNSNAVRYLNQNFEALRSQYRSSGQLFCDPMFPAEPESLGFKELGRNSYKVRGVTWKRPGVRIEPDRVWAPGPAQVNPGQVLMGSSEQIQDQDLDPTESRLYRTNGNPGPGGPVRSGPEEA